MRCGGPAITMALSAAGERETTTKKKNRIRSSL